MPQPAPPLRFDCFRREMALGRDHLGIWMSLLSSSSSSSSFFLIVVVGFRTGAGIYFRRRLITGNRGMRDDEIRFPETESFFLLLSPCFMLMSRSWRMPPFVHSFPLVRKSASCHWRGNCVILTKANEWSISEPWFSCNLCFIYCFLGFFLPSCLLFGFQTADDVFVPLLGNRFHWIGHQSKRLNKTIERDNWMKPEEVEKEEEKERPRSRRNTIPQQQIQGRREGRR